MNIPGFDETLTNTKRHLLSARNTDGFWEGELSTSALSTATAMCALAMMVKYDSNHFYSDDVHHNIKHLIHDGVNWLCKNQNKDGGWGDTIKSHSNISTTVLAWAALGLVTQRSDEYEHTVEKAEKWITEEAGGISPEHITQRILKKYGKDKTFSVPILTHCALTGKLSSPNEAWQNVLQLPFELAAFPHSWFAAMRLPVVSYALPALIAIGVVRHHHNPTKNVLLRWIRNVVKAKTLRKLESIQPASGGFLEAVPLTSFVTMSLAASVGVDHAVAQNGLRFLFDSVRDDGSWAIDSNLATWVTTLSINALAQSEIATGVDEPQRKALLDYLLHQQYRTKHPYTHADRGGWAWTHLPGGVPDADDTAGALWALQNLHVKDDRTGASAEMGIEWLLGLQNADGGVPTFCRGWANLPFDRSCADITAHAIKAIADWKPSIRSSLRQKVNRFEHKAFRYLAHEQFDDGAWIPLWFGNQDEPKLQNKVYGTAQVIAALAPLKESLSPEQIMMVQRGVDALLSMQKNDGSWGGGTSSPSSIEETSLALTALGVYKKWEYAEHEKVSSAIGNGAAWLIQKTQHGTLFDASPIGFYFAELWYYERLYPVIYTLHALNTVRSI